MRHGKDTVAEMLHQMFGLTFESSSIAASRIFLYEALKDKYGYTTPEECFEDRVNHRAEWHDLIVDFNREDKARLAKEILKTSDIYVGMRSNIEAEACIEQGIFDYIIGVYDPRKPEEPKDSFNIDLWEKCNFVIPNGGTLPQLQAKVFNLGLLILNSNMDRHLMIERFADQMQIELDKNDHKGSIFDWRGIEDKVGDLTYHNAKMLLALRTGNKLSVKEYIADSANILLSIGVEGGLYEEDSVNDGLASELEEVVFRRVPLNKQKRSQKISDEFTEQTQSHE